MKEWFLTVLIVLYLVLVIHDRPLLLRTPELIDWNSLALITSLTLVSKGLELSGMFTRLSLKLIGLSRGSEKRFLFILLPVIALSSAVIMNDTVMLVFIPLVVTTARLVGIDATRPIVLSAIAANVGSSLTPIGNPQNVIIWSTYGLSFLEFTFGMLPFVLLWILLLLMFTTTLDDSSISLETPPPVVINGRLLLVSLLLLIADVCLAEIGEPLLALSLTLSLLLFFGREALLCFDWVLVMTFALIFVDFGEVARLLSGHTLPSEGVSLFLASAGLSQLISNVPATVIFLGQKPEWLPLALGVNLGGNGLVMGSLANLIAIRISGIRISDFHRFSMPYFLMALMVSILLLLL